MPRLLRDSPLNSIWEGSGNVIALDVLRALEREPQAFDAFMAEVEEGAGRDERLDGAARRLRDEVMALDPATAPYGARRLAERMALVLQASLVVRHSPPVVAEAFLEARLERGGGRTFGTLPAGV